MKPLSLTLCCGILCCAIETQAQTDGKQSKADNAYGFVQLQGGIGTTFTKGVDASSLLTPTYSIAGGYHFSPAIGLRMHVNGFESKGGFESGAKYKYNYTSADIDVMLNLLGIAKKTMRCPLDLYLVGGVGLTYAWGNGEFWDMPNANITYAAWGKDPRKTLLSHNLTVGVLADYNISKHWSIGAEVDLHSLSDRFNSKADDNKDDKMLTAQLSLTYKLGHRPIDGPVKDVEAGMTAPRKALLADILQDRLSAWSKKLPNESLEDYNLRVNDNTRAKQMRLLNQELATEKGLAEIGLPTMKLGGYNTAKNLLAVGLSDGLPDIYLNMDEGALTNLKASNLELRNVKYGLRDDESLEIVYADVYDRSTGKTYTYNNLDGNLPDYESQQLALTPLTALKKATEEKATLEKVKEDVTKLAKEQNLLTDHTNVKVKANVVPGVDANGKAVQNYEVGVSYTVEKAFSMRDDFAAGKYKVTESNAGVAMMKIIKQTLGGEFAKYMVPGKRVKVKISGTADATPIRNTIAYDGVYGDFVKQPVTQDGKPSTITVTRANGISANNQLAFLRAVGVKDYMTREIPAFNKMKADYSYDISVSPREGSEYRKVSVVLTFEDAF